MGMSRRLLSRRNGTCSAFSYLDSNAILRSLRASVWQGWYCCPSCRRFVSPKHRTEPEVNKPRFKLFSRLPILFVILGIVSSCKQGSTLTVSSTSMVPTVKPGDRLIWAPLYLGKGRLRRYDIVLFEPPFDRNVN